MKTVQFSLKPAAIVATTIVLRIFKNAINVRRNKKEFHIGTGYRLYSLITILFTTNLLFCIELYVGHLSQCVYQKTLFGIPWNLYCC